MIPATPPARPEAPHAARWLLNGQPVALTAEGALHLPAFATLVVADLHLEKGSAYAARGQFLPPYDTAATLARLARVIARLAPLRVIALGDSFHDDGGPARLTEADRARLAALVDGREWIWIAGNHDPTPPIGIGGDAAAEWRLGPLTFRHEPQPGHAAGEVAGHLHPCARVVGSGRAVRRRCFAADRERLVMPAFGALTGGLDVLDGAFRNLFPAGGFHAFMLGETVHAVSVHRLAGGGAARS